ncbi:MAG: hypothetical protein ACK55I_11575, partial [bacterium]
LLMVGIKSSIFAWKRGIVVRILIVLRQQISASFLFCTILRVVIDGRFGLLLQMCGKTLQRDL